MKTKPSPINYILVTDSATEPLSLAEVKTYLRIDGTDYDNILTPLIKKVRQLAEKITGRDFINKTWKTYLDYFPDDCEGVELRKSKLQSITHIKYYASSVLTTLSSAVYYNTDESFYSSIYVVDGQTYPVSDDIKQSVVITFVSGYGSSSTDVPQALRQAMLSHIAYLFENTGDCGDQGVSQFQEMYAPYIVPQKMILFI